MDSVPAYAFGTAYDIVDDKDDTNDPGASVSGDQFKALLEKACKMGCRHFDCAPLYGTQALIGQYFRSTIGRSETINLSRSELFFTSKLPVNMMRPDKMDECLKMILDELQIGYLDLFVVHAPFSTKFIEYNNYYPKDEDGNLMLDAGVNLEKTWMKMKQFKEQGLVRLIGLSNVNVSQLRKLDALYHVDLVQNEFHLYHQDNLVREECKKLNVHFEGFAAMGSPLTAARYGKTSPLADKLVKKMAEKYQRTPAQIVVMWLLEKDISFVIKSDNMGQLEENLSAAIDQSAAESLGKISLDAEDIISLDALNRNDRVFYYDNHPGLSDHPEYPFERRIGFTVHS